MSRAPLRFDSNGLKCVSCLKDFKSSAGLESHLRQAARCHWVLEERAELRPAVVPDYRPSSSKNIFPSAPSLPQSNDDPERDPANDVFAAFDDVDGPEDQPEVPSDTLHDHDHRARVEDALDDEDNIYVETITDAGKVHRVEEKIHSAYAKLKAASSDAGLYAPFKDVVDYEVARWHTEEGPGSNAFTRLLEIPGVSVFYLHQDSMLIVFRRY